MPSASPVSVMAVDEHAGHLALRLVIVARPDGQARTAHRREPRVRARVLQARHVAAEPRVRNDIRLELASRELRDALLP